MLVLVCKYYIQSLCKSLREIRNHTKKSDFRSAVSQPPQQSYNREPGSPHATHNRAIWGLYILKTNCTEGRRDSQRFWTRQGRQELHLSIQFNFLAILARPKSFRIPVVFSTYN